MSAIDSTAALLLRQVFEVGGDEGYASGDVNGAPDHPDTAVVLPDEEEDDPVKRAKKEKPRTKPKSPSPAGGMNPETASTPAQDALRAVFEGALPSAGWSGPTLGQAQAPHVGTGFPFRTKAAEKVYAQALTLMQQCPDMPPAKIKKFAVDAAAVLTVELTPEDEAILDMAIYYASTNRTALAGAPAVMPDSLPVNPRGHS